MRGHGFGFELGSTKLSFFESVVEARKRSLPFIHKTLEKMEVFCKEHHWPGPKRGDDNWQTEYLDEDVFLHVIPRERQGIEILMRAFSVLERKGEDEAQGQ